jgi:tRNA-2-methylthio-N6-dimethylallyladenosine synthase
MEEIIAEARKLVAEGVREITLLGQNVNSYGRDIYGDARFAEVLAKVAESGIERLRFATSHPKDLSEATIEAFANIRSVMPAFHLPVQSGSSRILRAMNRNYTAEQYLELVANLRAACKKANKPAPALSTDIIVGFPGETEDDFCQTLALATEVGYAQAFTFIYSPRAGTPAAELEDNTPAEVIQERFSRLVEVVQKSAWKFNQSELGEIVPVLFEGISKRNQAMLTGRSPRNQTVHALLPKDMTVSQFAGRILPVRVESCRTWYLQGSLILPEEQSKQL